MAGVDELSHSALEAAKKAKPSADQIENPKTIAAAGVALIALPYVAKGISKLAGGGRSGNGGGTGKVAEVAKKATEGIGDKAKDVAKDVAGEAMDEKMKGAPKGVKSLIGGAIPGLGDSGSGSDSDSESDGGSSAAPGHGSGRRMPIQQSVDVAIPVSDAWNLWTQFEEWPSFMHRVDQADQVDETTLAISTKVWGITKRFEANIVEQVPDERIEWDVESGLSHTGVATFHELAPRLTRIEITVDVEPDSLLEKAGRGMRFAKRAVRGDLHRFKAYAELYDEEIEEGSRETISDGEVKQQKAESKSGGSRSKGNSSSGSRSRSKSGSSRSSGRSRNGSGSSSSRSKSRSGS